MSELLIYLGRFQSRVFSVASLKKLEQLKSPPLVKPPLGAQSTVHD